MYMISIERYISIISCLKMFWWTHNTSFSNTLIPVVTKLEENRNIFHLFSYMVSALY